MSGLRSLGKVLEEAFACPHCGGSKMVKATAWRGHGTGQPGASAYSPTAHEAIHPARHCVCVGGPVWQRLIPTVFGRSFRLPVCEWQWKSLEEELRQTGVTLWKEEDQTFRFILLEAWRQFLIENWHEMALQ